MALIPITFNKDDTNNDKKGIVRAKDLAYAINMCTTTDVGVLDLFNNSCEQYGAINISAGYASLTLHAGYITIYGRLIYIEENTQIQIPLPTTNVTGYLGIRIDLAQVGSNEVTWFATSDNLRTDDLSKDNSEVGVYEFALYSYSANSTNFTLNKFVAPKILKIKDYMQGNNFVTQENTDNSNKIATTAFVKNVIGVNQEDLTCSAKELTNVTLGNSTINVYNVAERAIIVGRIDYMTTYSSEDLFETGIVFDNFKLKDGYSVIVTPIEQEYYLVVAKNHIIVGTSVTKMKKDSFSVFTQNINSASSHSGFNFIVIGEFLNEE